MKQTRRLPSLGETEPSRATNGTHTRSLQQPPSCLFQIDDKRYTKHPRKENSYYRRVLSKPFWGPNAWARRNSMPADDYRRLSFSLRGRLVRILLASPLLILLNAAQVLQVYHNETTTSSSTPAVVPVGSTDPILRRMQHAGHSLKRSARQQASFLAKKDNLTQIFSELRRFPVHLAAWAANRVTDDYAYLHIFKCGGTTISQQTLREHEGIQHPEVQKRKWFSLVRDPIDHFLSGWAEIGNTRREQILRSQKRDPTTPFDPSEPVPRSLLMSYDRRVRIWLHLVQREVRSSKGWRREVHSAPQVNFMLNPDGMVWHQLEIVGDLKELPAVLDLVGFTFDPSKESGRNATADLFLQTHYPRRPDLLSNETIRMLCDFLAIDYYLLDYPLPEPCRDMPITGYTVWRRMVVQTLRAEEKSSRLNRTKAAKGFHAFAAPHSLVSLGQ